MACYNNYITQLGETKTLSQLQERFYWPGHREAVKGWCRSCPDCAARKNPTHGHRALLQCVKACYPLHVTVDTMGPFLHGQSGNAYILVVSDYFTRWLEAYSDNSR